MDMGASGCTRACCDGLTLCFGCRRWRRLGNCHCVDWFADIPAFTGMGLKPAWFPVVVNWLHSKHYILFPLLHSLQMFLNVSEIALYPGLQSKATPQRS